MTAAAAAAAAEAAPLPDVWPTCCPVDDGVPGLAPPSLPLDTLSEPSRSPVMLTRLCAGTFLREQVVEGNGLSQEASE